MYYVYLYICRCVYGCQGSDLVAKVAIVALQHSEAKVAMATPFMISL